MHIAHVTSFFAAPPLGPSSAVRSRGLAYRAAGHEFTVIVPGREASVAWAEYGTVITVPARGRSLSRGFVPIAKAIRHALENLVPDHIEVADRLSAREIGSWAQQNRIPAIYIVDPSNNSAPSIHDLVGYDRVVSVAPIAKGLVRSENTPDSAQDAGDSARAANAAAVSATASDDELIHAPAGVNLEVFSPLRHNSTLRDSSNADMVLLSATPLTAAGIPALAVDVVKRLVAAGENVHLVILGDGPLLGRLERSTIELPVQFLSARDLELAERAEVFATADITLVTVGSHDGHAVALESLASGTPVVATSACSPSLMFVDGGGLSVEPDLTHIEHALRIIQGEPVENRRNVARATALPYDSAESERTLLALHESLRN
ncbi:MAG: glycosyltransferase [Salinibacterium amurskyense]